MRALRKFVVANLLILGGCISQSGCLNPFAPGLDTSPAESACNPASIEGVFRCFQTAYTFRDTTDYGKLLAADFVFIYRDYDLGIDVTWGRDEEMRATYGLFQNAPKLDLIWNNIISIAPDSTNVIRGFNLTITFNANDVVRIDGYANISLTKAAPADPWKITRWRDESNF